MPEPITLWYSLLLSAGEIGLWGLSIILASSIVLPILNEFKANKEKICVPHHQKRNPYAIPSHRFFYHRVATHMLDTFRDMFRYLSTPNGTPLSSRPEPVNAPEHEYYTVLANLAEALGKHGAPERAAQQVAQNFLSLREAIRTNKAVQFVEEGIDPFAGERKEEPAGLAPTAMALYCLAMQFNATCAFARIPASITGSALTNNTPVTRRLISSAADELGGNGGNPHSEKLNELIAAIGDIFGFKQEQLQTCQHLLTLKKINSPEQFSQLMQDLLYDRQRLDDRGVPQHIHSLIPTGISSISTHIPNKDIAAALRLFYYAEPFLRSWQDYNEALVEYGRTTPAEQAAYFTGIKQDAYPYVVSLLMNAYHEMRAELRPNCLRGTHIDALGKVRVLYAYALAPQDTRGIDHASTHNDAEHAADRKGAASIEDAHAQDAYIAAIEEFHTLAEYNPVSALATLQKVSELIAYYESGLWAKAAEQMELASQGEQRLPAATYGAHHLDKVRNSYAASVKKFAHEAPSLPDGELARFCRAYTTSRANTPAA